jgi:protocatechuate 3,4-dioxygenase beta subunit
VTPVPSDSVVTENGCLRSQTRSWTATDACGNQATVVSRTVTWTVDVEPPVITASGTPANGQLGCNPTAAQIEAALGTASATDNCGPVTPVPSDSVVTENGCLRSQTRSWTATDACGNQAVVVSRTVTWTEDAGPQVTNPLSNQVVCEGESVQFCIGVSSACGATYTWYKDGVLIPGASGTCYTIAQAGLPDVGQYCVVISSPCHSVTNCATLQLKAALGDYVWEDRNYNGCQDMGEPPVANVQVILKDCSGNTVASTSTDANGLYFFTCLNPGGYQVQVIPPSGYYVTIKDNSSCGDDKDSDANPATGITDCTTLNPGETNRTVDIGLFRPASIGDFVWEDTNANGVQDDGATGIPNVTVTLTDCAGNPVTDINGNAVGPQMTDVNGYYLFTNLKPGCYKVHFGTPPGYVSSPANQGGDDTKDSDAVAGVSGNYTLNSGDSDLTVDAGFYKPASIGNYVWEDLNANGIQDDGATGIPNVTVRLTDCTGNPVTDMNGNPVGPQVTDLNGYYKFENLKPGQYQVVFTAPGGYVVTQPFQGGNLATDSNADPLTGKSDCRTLVSGQYDDTVDAGLYRPASIGNYVWLDVDGDGTQNEVNTGVANVTVTLTDCAGNPVTDINGNPVPPTTTSATGYYQFANLKPGQYQVTFTLPSDYVFTQLFQGGNPALDSNADPVTGKSDCRTLVSGQYDDTVDAGLLTCDVTVGVFCSLITTPTPASTNDCKGKVVRMTMRYTGDDCSVMLHSQAAGKATCSGVTGPLPNTVLIRATTASSPTDLSGMKWFEGTVTLGSEYVIDSGGAGRLSTDTYIHIFDTSGNRLQSIKVHTSCSQPLAVGNQFGANLVVSMTTTTGGTVTLEPPQPPTPQEVCTLPASSGNNCDSKIEVLQMAWIGGGCANSQNTQAAGKVVCTEFGPLPAGQVYIVANNSDSPTTAPFWFQGYVTANQLLEIKASNGGASQLGTDTRVHIFDTQGGTRLQYLKFHTSCSQPVNLGDVYGGLLVFGIDTTASALKTLGAEVQFTYAITNVGPVNLNSIQVTDAFGPVDVSGVALPILPGETRLLVVKYTLTGPITNTVTVQANGGLCGASDLSIIERETPPQSCCDYGRVAALLMEYTAGGCAASKHSQAADKVVCANYGPLPDMVYIIANNSDTPTASPVWFSGWVSKGGTFLIDATRGGATTLGTDTRIHIYTGDPSAGGVRVEFVKFHTSCSQPLFSGNQFGSSLVQACFGQNQPLLAALGDFAWKDLNENGRQDAGEPGISGVAVELQDCSGNVLRTAVTDGAGKYLFANLTPGNYRVQFILPTGYVFTSSNVGDDASDSDADPATGVTACVTLNTGQTNRTVDAGLVETPACFVLVKSASQPIITPGGQVIYTYEVTNPSASPITDLLVTDDNGTPGFPSDDFVVGSVASLGAGQSVNFTVTTSPPLPMCMTVNGTNMTVGTLATQILPNGDVKVTYLQSRSVNDNTYGTGVIGWPGNNHTFNQLLGSDNAQFVFYNAAGQKVLDVTADYISQSAAYPSGYGTLGVTGGDGGVSYGSAAMVESVMTTLTRSLNQSPAFYGYTVNSPLPESNFPTWEYVNGYELVIKAAAFGGSGFGRVEVPVVHNSPSKLGFNAQTPSPCGACVTNTAVATAKCSGQTLTASAQAVVCLEPQQPGGALPSPWQAQDIGSATPAGSASYDAGSGTFTVLGAGSDIGGSKDAFQYVYQAANGDCTIIANVLSVQKTDKQAKAGVMIRESLTADSKHASVLVTPDSGIQFRTRTTTGGSTSSKSKSGLTAPYWVKVVRSGSTFTGYYSSDGVAWTSMGSVTISMGSNVYLGLGVTSKKSGTLCTATFNNVTATP